MADSTCTPDNSDAATCSTRASSQAPPASTVLFTIATPTSIKTDLEAAQARARKRKASCEIPENDPDRKKLRATKDAAPVKNRGGRPRKERPTRPKQPSGPLRLRVCKPVQAYLPAELWNIVFEYSSPALLLRARRWSHAFHHSLTNGSSVWSSARKTTYGPDHPDPPAGLNEVQYAELLEGQGCQGCSNAKTRKTYWAFLRRWCEDCLLKRVVNDDEADQIMHPYTGYRECVPQAIRDSWNHYQWIGSSPSDLPEWASYQKHAHTVFLRSGPQGLEALKAKVDAFNQPNMDGTLKTNDEITKFFEDVRQDMAKKMEQRAKVENWEGWRRKAHKAATKQVTGERRDAIIQRAAKLNPLMDRACLEKMTAYKNATLIAKPLTDRSWSELKPKLLVEMKELQIQEAREAKENEQARIAKEYPPHEALEDGQTGVNSCDFGNGNTISLMNGMNSTLAMPGSLHLPPIHASHMPYFDASADIARIHIISNAIPQFGPLGC